MRTPEDLWEEFNRRGGIRHYEKLLARDALLSRLEAALQAARRARIK